MFLWRRSLKTDGDPLRQPRGGINTDENQFIIDEQSAESLIDETRRPGFHNSPRRTP
ncbi:hypothetical protein BN874_150015 [Candidatus Contendobacter odensis Run_B_J11]|uniref:Uncharacterized protein n=1 Tax=Candidatus Contendobacter odensis Run_B_J11 TaxID=1400861 RepID=A0A7U7J320_9GAMM|nr:hypothetical protein BN874_150015 [Candidatus Contendobacter odensis Run_B_J11]